MQSGLRACEVSITGETTVSDDHPAKQDDPQASLRAELLGQIVGAQAVLEAALADLAGADPTVRDRLRSQISQIAGLRQQVGMSQGAALSALRAEVATVADSATAAAQDARTSAAADSSSTSTIGTLARTARDQTNSVMAGMKDFDRDLKFSTPEDKAAYREREAERQSYIAAQQAKHTPEGDLNASGAAVGQMADAKAHGASGPEFDKRWDALVATTERLREAVQQSGGSTKEFDDHLRTDLRQIMKSKGLTDAQIDAQFAANPDPLAAAKAYVKNDDDTQKIMNAAQSAGVPAAPRGSIAAASPVQDTSMADAIAKLQQAGASAAIDPATEQGFAHGVSQRLPNSGPVLGA
jgi:hypothetical protein